jgi:hypothetical protein
VEITERRPLAALDGETALHRPHRKSPHARRVLTRVLFLACFGVGDFSVLHGRHAMASQRPAPGSTATLSAATAPVSSAGLATRAQDAAGCLTEAGRTR